MTLYLAQVQQGLSGEVGLRLLARQEAEFMWAIMTEEIVIPTAELSEGLLALVELSSTGKILSLENATTWVLELVQIYLTGGITPTFLQQEGERSEQWRQTLTLQNQDLARRLLELEARREQIEALEESFKRDKADDTQEEGERGGA